MLWACLATAVVAVLLDVAPVFAEQRTAPEATQHALDELANCYAQRRPECPTPTPTATSTPRPIATATPLLAATATPAPEDLSDPPASTPDPTQCWLTSEDPDIGDPNNGGIVFDGDGNPIPCDAVIPNENAPADGLLPPPDATATPIVIVQRVTIQAPAPPPQIVYRQAAAPAPEVIYVEVTPQTTGTPELVPTATPRPYVTATRVPTPTPTVWPSSTATATSTPTDEPTPAVTAMSADPPSAPGPLTPMDILSKIGIGGLVLGFGAIVVWAVTAREERV